MIPDQPPAVAPERRLRWIPRTPEVCPRCKLETRDLIYSRAIGWRCPKCAPARGQALVEFAIVAPILFLVLLACLGFGLFFVAQEAQASRTATVASYAAANPTEDAVAWAASLTSCPVTVTLAANVVTATVDCPNPFGGIAPGVPANIVTTAVAYTDATTGTAP